MINSTLSIGVEGVQRGINDARRHAQEIASAGASGEAGFVDITRPLFELQNDLRQVQASAEVISVVDEIVTTTLDAIRSNDK